jgi:8-oxo-dGTP pyrophosphatase MutT (NUDIX family)
MATTAAACGQMKRRRSRGKRLVESRTPLLDGRLEGRRNTGTGARVRVLHERSAGGLVHDREHGKFYGLIIGRSTPRIWSLPKGHIEQNESIEDAATREVLEETGIAGTIIVKLSDIRYWFYANKSKHSKIVHFFLMRYVGGSPLPQPGEVDEVRWVPLDELADLLTHVNERRLIEIAHNIVREQAPSSLGFH